MAHNSRTKNFGLALMCPNAECKDYRRKRERQFFSTEELNCKTCDHALVKYINSVRLKQDERARRELKQMGAL